MDKSFDHYTRRCPRLGGPVSFEYCRTLGSDGKVCWKIADCWWEYFDVVAYLKNNLGKAAVERLARKRPKPKVTTILDLIQKAREAEAEKDN